MSRGDTSLNRDRQEARRQWYQQAYRQMVDKDSWESAELVDPRTQAFLETMPDRASGLYFKGPDNRYRVLGREQREKPATMQHRVAAVSAWLEKLPKKAATRYAELSDLDADYPHPGEEEQINAWMQETPMLNPNAPAFGAVPEMPADTKTIQVAKAPLGPKTIVADVPFDQMPRVPIDHLPSRPLHYGRTGRVTTQPPHEIKPVTMPEPAGTPAWQKTAKRLLGVEKEITPVANFAAPAAQPYPSAPGILPVDRTLPALDLQPEELRNMPWERLADRLRSRDNYDPRDFATNFKNQEPRQHARRGTSPEVAAQDAIDAAHELNLAKGRDWGTDLPRDNPRAIMGEYDHAVETLVKEAGDFWSERVRRQPLAAEIEMMRAYVKPRVAAYFPTDVQATIKGEAATTTSLPRIKDGPQGAQELVTALVFGEIKEITINGDKVDLGEIQADRQSSIQTNHKAGSLGGPEVRRFNYLIGQALKRYLEACKEVSGAEIVGGPTAPDPDGGFSRIAEAFFQNPFNPGIKGSARTDVAIRLRYGDQECTFNINTVDINGNGSLTARELGNLLRAITNAAAMTTNWEDSQLRWKETLIKEGRMIPKNVFATQPKPADKSEADLQKAIEDFLSRLTCAKIIAACEKGNGLVDTATTPTE